MKTTPASTDNETTKVKRLREDRFCVFLLFFLSRFCFVMGHIYYVFVKLKKKIITKNLVIIFKLNTIESVYYIERNLGFFCFCHTSPREIAKEKE
jgi:hypothetical protein